MPTNKAKIALYAGSGFGAALVGVIQTILYNGAQVANGQSVVFNSIIAVVIGGVLTGGYGSVVGVLLGTLTFAIVNQGIYYTGWNADWAALILGILLLVAVLMNNTFRRLALSTVVKEATHVLRIIMQARQKGIAVIFVTHNVLHAISVGDHFAVLIRGEKADDFRKGERTREQITDLMAGGEAMASLEAELAEMQTTAEGEGSP